jgi:magnesium-transporting ATPase (P-type)
MKLYRKCLPSYAEVKINGKWVKIDPTGVLIGDLVRVVAGCYVPADLRIIEV